MSLYPSKGSLATTLTVLFLIAVLLLVVVLITSVRPRRASADELVWTGPGTPSYEVFPSNGPEGYWMFPGGTSSDNVLTVTGDIVGISAAGGFYYGLVGGVSIE